MIENVAALFPTWRILTYSLNVNVGNGQLIVGANPKRWCIAFQLPSPAIGTTLLHAWQATGCVQFNLTIATDQPLRLDQRDWGPIPAGPFYFDAGGAMSIIVTEFIWEG